MNIEVRTMNDAPPLPFTSFIYVSPTSHNFCSEADARAAAHQFAEACRDNPAQWTPTVKEWMVFAGLYPEQAIKYRIIRCGFIETDSRSTTQRTGSEAETVDLSPDMYRIDISRIDMSTSSFNKEGLTEESIRHLVKGEADVGANALMYSKTLHWADGHRGLIVFYRPPRDRHARFPERTSQSGWECLRNTSGYDVHEGQNRE
jgi:hypothetical protein